MVNKLGKRKYIQLIADTLLDIYGDSLRDCSTDVKMAEAVVDKLQDFLYFHPIDISYNDYKRWKKARLENE